MAFKAGTFYISALLKAPLKTPLTNRLCINEPVLAINRAMLIFPNSTPNLGHRAAAMLLRLGLSSKK